MREAVWALLLGVAVGCGQEVAQQGPLGSDLTPDANTQASYTYPECEGGTAYCPGDKAIFCAVETIRRKYTACAQDSDCIQVMLGDDCVGTSACGSVVHRDSAHLYRQEAQAELRRYCGPSPSCVGSGSCPAQAPVCRSGACTWTAPYLEDGGT